MELHVLNTEFKLIAVLDDFLSLVWSERHYSCGDFELCVSATSDMISVLNRGNYVKKTDSDTLMIIETVLMESDSEHGKRLTASGRAFESILDRRIIWGQKKYTDTYIDQQLSEILFDTMISPTDSLRTINGFFVQNDRLLDRTDLTVDAERADKQYTGDNVYDIFERTCKAYGLGYRIKLLNKKDPDLYLPLYMLNDSWKHAAIDTKKYNTPTGESKTYIRFLPNSSLADYRISTSIPIRINAPVSLKFLTDSMMDSDTDKNYMVHIYYAYPSSQAHPAYIYDGNKDSKFQQFQSTVQSIWSQDITLDEKSSLLFESGYRYSIMQDVVDKILNEQEITLEYLTDDQLRELDIEYYLQSIRSRGWIGPSNTLPSTGNPAISHFITYPTSQGSNNIITADGTRTGDAYVFIQIAKEGSFNVSESGTSGSYSFDDDDIDMCDALGSIGFKLVNNNGEFPNLDKIPPDYLFKFSFEQGELKKYICFSSDYDNLISSNYLTSESEFKTIALVAGEDISEDNTRIYISMEQTDCPVGSYCDLDRRELFVDARDLQSTDDEGQPIPEEKYIKKLVNRGKEKLQDALCVAAIEGEADTTSFFKYGRDFKMGDVVTVKDDFGHSLLARVTETVESYDESGYSLHPTFETV